MLRPQPFARSRPGRAPAPATDWSRATGGFTILEILLAIGIFMMILTAIYATWISILKGSQAGQKAAAEVQRSRIAMRTIEDAFTSTEFFVANMKHYLFFADTSGDMADVELATRLPGSFLGVGRYGDQVLRRVRFFTQAGKDGRSELMMSQHPVLLKTEEGGAEAFTITLAQDVTLFRMAFYDAQKNEWLDEWKYTNQLPKVVKIALGLGRDKNNKAYDVATTLVALPSVGVAPDVQGASVAPPPTGVPNPGDLGNPMNPMNPMNPATPGNPYNPNFPQPGFPQGGRPGFPGNSSMNRPGFPGMNPGMNPGRF